MVNCHWNGSKKRKWRRLPASLLALPQKVNPAKTIGLPLVWLIMARPIMP
jgi:hypothetical protein